nr:hypothetical protein HmN_000981700 [Hymenolepis microstoma]
MVSPFCHEHTVKSLVPKSKWETLRNLNEEKTSSTLLFRKALNHSSDEARGDGGYGRAEPFDLFLESRSFFYSRGRRDTGERRLMKGAPPHLSSKI